LLSGFVCITLSRLYSHEIQHPSYRQPGDSIMKRMFASAVVVIIGGLIIITAVFATRSSAVPLRLNKKDIPEHGLIIVGQPQPEFASLRKSLRKGAILAERLPQPYVFIKNLNNKRAVAYSIKWELVKDDGQVVSRIVTYCREDVLKGEEAPEDKNDRIILRSHKARLFSFYGYGDGEEVLLNSPPSEENEQATDNEMLQKLEQAGVAARANDELSHTVSVNVSIDGAFFEDGTFVGPNTTSYFERVRAQTGAKQEMLEAIIGRWKAGAKAEDVMKYLEERAEALKTAEIAPAPDATPVEISNYYEKRHLDELLSMRTPGESADLTLRRALHYNKPGRHLNLRKADK
jgi:hypothetical protein